jgi:hypothetical protein
MTIPLLKIKVLPKATVKGKMDVRFPANVYADNFLTVTKANGAYTFGVDYTLVATTPVADTSTAITVIYDQADGIYKQVTIATLVSVSLATKADIASPTFTGVPRAPTAAVNTNTTQLATTAFVLGQAGTATPLIDGTATVGTATKFAREDHIHPTDTTRAPLASPTFTGDPKAPTPTAGDNDTSIATTAFVTGAITTATVSPATVAPLMDGVAAVGVATKYAREDHKHPTDTTLAPLASPTFTGDPKAPTASPGDNDTSIATTAFVTAAIAAGSSNFLQAGTGAVTRTMQNKARDIVSVLDYGADNTGATSAVAAIQAAIDYAAPLGKRVYCPAGKYKIDSGLTITIGVTIEGDGWQGYTTYATGTTPSVPGAGTWFYISHTGAPFITVQQPVSGRCGGVVMRDFAMNWTGHPAIGGGWTPTAYDWAVKCIGVDDVTLENLLFLNPYKAVQMTWKAAVGQAGRLNMRNCFGQPFFTGIDVDWSADVCCLDRIHFWPWWSDNSNVMSYTKTNGTFFRSGRNDNLARIKLVRLCVRAGHASRQRA